MDVSKISNYMEDDYKELIDRVRSLQNIMKMGAIEAAATVWAERGIQSENIEHFVQTVIHECMLKPHEDFSNENPAEEKQTVQNQICVENCSERNKEPTHCQKNFKKTSASSYNVRFCEQVDCYFVAQDPKAETDAENVEIRNDDDTYSHSDLTTSDQFKKSLDFASKLCQKLDQLSHFSENQECGAKFRERLISKADELQDVIERRGSCSALQVLAEDILAFQRTAKRCCKNRTQKSLEQQKSSNLSQDEQAKLSPEETSAESRIEDEVTQTVGLLRDLCQMCPPCDILDIKHMTLALKEAILQNKEKVIARVTHEINSNIRNIIKECKL